MSDFNDSLTLHLPMDEFVDGSDTELAYDSVTSAGLVTSTTTAVGSPQIVRHIVRQLPET